MGTRRALLDPADVQRRRSEIHLLPPQVHQFGGPQAVPVGHKDHRGVPVPPTVSLGRVHQPLDLGFRQVLTGAEGAVRWPLGLNCSIYGGWRDQPEVPLDHAFRDPRPNYCSDNGCFTDSLSTGPSTHALKREERPHPPFQKVGVKPAAGAWLACSVSAFGGKADMPVCTAYVSFDPKRTLPCGQFPVLTPFFARSRATFEKR
jgi:hypothetical protein